MQQPLENSKKAILTNRIFLDATVENIQKISKTLTYRIPSTNPLIPRPTILKTYKSVTKNIISIPYGREDLIPKGTEIIDRRIVKPVEFPPPNFQLKPSQLAAALELQNGYGILNAPVGWGKTFTGLHIAAMLGQKTIVVVHNISLREQWQTEVKKLFGFEPGVIGSGKVDIHPILTIANVQTLVGQVDRLNSEFGTLILDEAHHVPATTFTNVVDKLKCRYKIGLTGTLVRKDGKHVIFTDYFGDIVVRPPSENVMYPKIHVYKSKIELPSGNCWADKITALLDTPDYIDLVCVLALIYAEKGHKVLLLSDRKLFQRKVQEILGDRCVTVDGDTSLPDREIAHKKIRNNEADILNGTMSIYKEGISESPLSCLICATPVNNEGLLEQLMGRVMRMHEGKLQPIVVDIQLKKTPTSNTAYRQAASRAATYMKLGYEVEQGQKNLVD